MPRKRRKFTASEKQRLLKDAAAAVANGEPGALEAFLRVEGIYSSHLSSWRQQLAAGGAAALTPAKPGRKAKLDDKDRQLVALAKRNAQLEKKLHLANAIIELQKKAHAILGIALPESDEASSNNTSRKNMVDHFARLGVIEPIQVGGKTVFAQKGRDPGL